MCSLSLRNTTMTNLQHYSEKYPVYPGEYIPILEPGDIEEDAIGIVALAFFEGGEEGLVDRSAAGGLKIGGKVQCLFLVFLVGVFHA